MKSGEELRVLKHLRVGVMYMGQLCWGPTGTTAVCRKDHDRPPEDFLEEEVSGLFGRQGENSKHEGGQGTVPGKAT